MVAYITLKKCYIYFTTKNIQLNLPIMLNLKLILLIKFIFIKCQYKQYTSDSVVWYIHINLKSLGNFSHLKKKELSIGSCSTWQRNIVLCIFIDPSQNTHNYYKLISKLFEHQILQSLWNPYFFCRENEWGNFLHGIWSPFELSEISFLLLLSILTLLSKLLILL